MDGEFLFVNVSTPLSTFHAQYFHLYNKFISMSLTSNQKTFLILLKLRHRLGYRYIVKKCIF